MRTAPAALRLTELTKIFGASRAVDRVSLSIEPGSMVALLGPSGCGKTTTLRMIAGLIQPEAGEIFLDDRPVTRVPVHRRNIGMLFQNYALFPHMNVAQNIAFGLETRGRRQACRRSAQRVGGCAAARTARWATASACRRSFPAASSSASRWRARWSSNRP